MIGRCVLGAVILYAVWRLAALMIGSAALTAGLMPVGILRLLVAVPWVVICLLFALAASLLALALGRCV